MKPVCRYYQQRNIPRAVKEMAIMNEDLLRDFWCFCEPVAILYVIVNSWRKRILEKGCSVVHVW